MRFAFYFPLLIAVLGCNGCVNHSNDTPPFTATELSERTAGLRAPYRPNPAIAFQRVDGVDPYSQPPTQRPGGTIVQGASGRYRQEATTFARATGTRPEGEVVLQYGYRSGGAPDGHPLPGGADAARVDLGGGFVSLNVRESMGGTVPLVAANGSNRALIRPGHKNYLAVHNATSQPVEVVILVNGHGLASGQPGSYRQRGYVIDPGSSVSVPAQLDPAPGEVKMGVFLAAGNR